MQIVKEQVEAALDRLQEKGLVPSIPMEAQNLANAAQAAGLHVHISESCFGTRVRVVDRDELVVYELVTDGQRRRFSIHNLQTDEIAVYRGVEAGFKALALEAVCLMRAKEASDV